MTRLHERIESRLSPAATFDFVADFANSSRWDPGVARSVRLDDGPLGPGARYLLDVRMGGRTAPMTYEVVAFERPDRVVLVGAGSGVDAVDTIVFEPSGDGTSIDYTADIRLRGLLGVVEPLLRARFERIGRDAAAGMWAALRELADDGSSEPQAEVSA